MNSYLLDKYNVPVPRYTSYPTVPYWSEGMDVAGWQQAFGHDFSAANQGQGISIYIHLPFCESLCTYCGCNKKITTNHSVEDGYIDAIHKEWELYRAMMDGVPVIKELHLGGGTPTFFSPANLSRLLDPILAASVVPEDHDFSFEGHPNNTTEEHLQVLFNLGFNRVSFGVQDNNAEVQRLINRIQPFENVKRSIETARSIGYSSVNFDLIYGLPGQTLESITRTVEQTIALRPDRIAFYSYAHVPWTSRGQRLFDEHDLPTAAAKLAMYAAARDIFTANGYLDIGMDHFALPTDDLCVAHQMGRLHRNFMGYTTQQTDVLLGLGVSAISSIDSGFAQNEKSLHNYLAAIEQHQLPVVKGIFLSAEDRRFGRYILDLACKGVVEYRASDAEVIERLVMPQLEGLYADGLVEISGRTVTITPDGRNFLRNICSVFDLHLTRQKVDKDKKVFSTSV